MEQTRKVRKSGGAKIISIPPFVLDTLGVDVEGSITFKSTETGEIVLVHKPENDAKTQLEKMFEGFSREDFKLTDEEREWESSTVGREII
jgi:antitoxin component of MazEF toxin-antitoxin module